MRALWLSVTPSLFTDGKVGGWIASLEQIFHRYLCQEIELGITFESDGSEMFSVEKNHTIFYPLKKYRPSGVVERIRNKRSIRDRWEFLRPQILAAILDFKPDIIHCFGSEWPYGAITSMIDVPVVIHMQGFLNIYNETARLAISDTEKMKALRFNPVDMIRIRMQREYNTHMNAFEQQIMRDNHYFMGRTQWDKRIVKYYSPNARYYHVPEAIRPEIYDAEKHWEWKKRTKYLFVTITQASPLKGNEIILRTADLLRNTFHMDFEWRVAGDRTAFGLFEKKSGIKGNEVGVKLLGMIDVHSVASELAHADLYIHPAMIDNSPNSLCEAQLIGCPVIAANVGGVPELVEDGETGFLYPYNEPHTLAFLIMSLLQDKNLMEKTSAEEIRTARERHDPESIARQVFETYQTVIDDYTEGEKAAKPE